MVYETDCGAKRRHGTSLIGFLQALQDCFYTFFLRDAVRRLLLSHLQKWYFGKYRGVQNSGIRRIFAAHLKSIRSELAIYLIAANLSHILPL
jgi:hypothetical protein